MQLEAPVYAVVDDLDTIFHSREADYFGWLQTGPTISACHRNVSLSKEREREREGGRRELQTKR
jgi:hypothetical protein